MKILFVYAWAVWGLLVVGAVGALVWLAVDQRSGPEVSRGFGPMLGLVLLGFVLGGGGLLWLAARAESVLWGGVLAVLMTYPLALMGARPIVLAYRNWRAERATATENVDDGSAP